MTNIQTTLTTREKEHWLMRYYFARSAFSIIWVAVALTAGRQSVSVAAVLLIVYPAWDAIANYVDAARNGGLENNRSQAINVVASWLMTVAVIVALTMSMNWVLGAFGLWAIFSAVVSLPLPAHFSSPRRRCRKRHRSPTSRVMPVSVPSISSSQPSGSPWAKSV
jgi:hypothetical protein